MSTAAAIHHIPYALIVAAPALLRRSWLSIKEFAAQHAPMSRGAWTRRCARLGQAPDWGIILLSDHTVRDDYRFAMPIYEYRCAACGHELEALQKLAESPLQVCPSCGQSRLQKLVSAAGFRLKGSGWYATDFKQRSQPAEKSNDTTAKAETAAPAADAPSAKPASGDAKTQSKPA